MEIYFYKPLLKIKQSSTPVAHIFVFNTLHSFVYFKIKQSRRQFCWSKWLFWRLAPLFLDGYMWTMLKRHFIHYSSRRQTVLFEQEGVIFQFLLYSHPISKKSERIFFFLRQTVEEIFWFIYISWMWSPGLHFIWSRSQAIKTNEHLLPQVGSWAPC